MIALHWLALLTLVNLTLMALFPIWWLLLLDLVTVTFVGGWSVGPLRIGAGDLMAVSVLWALVLRGRRSEPWRWGKLPLLLPWLVFGVLLCCSYLEAPANQRNLTDPIRVAYQLCRYCLRPIIYFPLALLLLRSPVRAYLMVGFIQGAAVLCSLMAIHQGYSGVNAAPGPFGTGNLLGGQLIVSFVLSGAGTVFPRTRRSFVLNGLALLLITRALLFTQSRGAMVAAGAGAVFFAVLLLSRHLGRRRLAYLAPLAFLALIASLPLMPKVLANPFVTHALSASNGTEDSTMRWRMEQRWPHFWAIALANPWLGTGTAVDPALGDKANTPHNGFLSMLVMWGFPALAILLFFAFRTIKNGCRLFWLAPNPDHKIFGLSIASALVGLLTHQLVEATLAINFNFKVFWLFAAVSELAKRWPDDNECGNAVYGPARFPSMSTPTFQRFRKVEK